MRIEQPPCPARPRAARDRQPATRLIRAVMALAGPHAELVRHAERPWASITFAGTRHTLVLAFPGAAGVTAGEAFAEALAEHEFAIRGQLVADARVIGVVQDMVPEPSMAVEAELLLLEEG